MQKFMFYLEFYKYPIWMVLLLAGLMGIVIAQRTDPLTNIGFLVIGALVGIIPVFWIDETKRQREAQNLALAIYQELANRVARCCYDFEIPWCALLQKPTQRQVFDVRKFYPVTPVVYQSAGVSIAILDRAAIQKVIIFYVFLEILGRDLESISSNAQQEKQRVSVADVKIIAERLRRTLAPGLAALEALAPSVKGAADIDAEAIRQLDANIPHPHHDKSLRERLQIAIREAKAIQAEPRNESSGSFTE